MSFLCPSYSIYINKIKNQYERIYNNMINIKQQNDNIFNEINSELINMKLQLYETKSLLNKESILYFILYI